MLLLIAAPAAFATDVTFFDAKVWADRDEKSLSAEQQLALAQSQAPVVQAAMSSCLVANGPDPFSFVVVVELDSAGKVLRTWRRGDSQVAVCFQSMAAKATLFSPPKSPFYSSFEMNLPASAISH
ncbi:hypothetical protein [Dyella silvae]|uniref:hypothetical protein n=1 Tax=Dyella silvae TaxID=2994424 RepID=UPI002263DABF|nr:hypothetical protein [Dyella silvae]